MVSSLDADGTASTFEFAPLLLSSLTRPRLAVITTCKSERVSERTKYFEGRVEAMCGESGGLRSPFG